MTEKEITMVLREIVAANTPMARVDAMIHVQRIVDERAWLLAALKRWRESACRCLGMSHNPPDHLLSCPILQVDDAIREVDG